MATYCSKCGSPISDGANACPQCGNPVVGAGYQSQPQYQQPQYQQPQYAQQQPQYQQPQYVQQPSQPQPDNYLVWAILTTIFCCLPFGIVSIVYSSKVSGLHLSGQYDAAVEAANNAKKWAWIAAIAGLVGGLLYFLILGGSIAGLSSLA